MVFLRFLYLALLTNFKRSLAFKASFLMTIFMTVLKQLLFLVGWKFFFEKYKLVQGWNFNDMLLMYGLVCFGMGFVEAFFYGLRDLPRMIESGQLDTFLLQPKNIILNISLSKGDMSAFGEIVTGLFLISYSGYMATNFFMVVLILIMSAVFLFSLLLYLGCIAFFIRDSYEFIRELNLNAIIVATQPNIAYRGALKMFTFTLLPVAFLSYFPIEYFRTGVLEHLWISLAGIGAFFSIACWIFKKGLKRYESGNMIVYRN